MKKMLPILLFLSLPHLIFAANAPVRESYLQYTTSGLAFYDPQLSHAVKSLLQVPECKQLLKDIQANGSIGLRFEHLGSHSSSAVWYGDQRVISVNASKQHSDGQKICSILFEMHNALNNYKFLQLDQLAREGKLNKESYIESIEKLEHQNALNTKKLLDKGVSIGVFPSDAKWPIIHSFDDHYKVQQIMGHSIQIGHAYDMLNPYGKSVVYKGTIQTKLTDIDKKLMLKYLALKDNLEYGNSKEQDYARHVLVQIFNEIRFKPQSHKGLPHAKMIVLNEAFAGNVVFEKMHQEINLKFR